jgi:cytochrome c1
MAGRSWSQLAAIARFDRTRFESTIRDPKSVKPGAKMPAHKDYDDATLHALTEYFRAFMLPSHGDRPGKDSTP